MKKLLCSTLLALTCLSLNAASGLAVKDFASFVKDKKAQTAFDDLIKGPKPVVVKFFLPGCGPCNATVATFEELAKKHSHAEFITLDVTKFDIGNRYGIRTAPTFIIFSKGKKIAQFKRGELVDTIEKELKKLS